MKFRNGSGDTEVRGMSGEFEAESGSGDIHAEGLRAPATVRTGSGDVRLKFETVPPEGAVEIRSGSGDAEVLFPQKSKIRTWFRAGSGTLKNTLGESHDARFSVNMKSGTAGNLPRRKTLNSVFRSLCPVPCFQSRFRNGNRERSTEQ